MKKLFIISMALLLAGLSFARDTGNVYHAVQVIDEEEVNITTITSVEIYFPDTTTNPVIYADRAELNAITLPMTTSSTNTTLVDGVFSWYGQDGYDFSITDGTNVRTNANHRTRTATEGRIHFPTYLNNLTTSAYLDADSITFGTGSDWVVNGGAVANTLQWTPAADDSTYNIGTSGTTANSNFNVYTGASLGFKLSSSGATHSLTYDGGIVNLNVNSNFATNINSGTSTGATTIGNSAGGAFVLDTDSTININADDSIDMSTSGASADIDIDAAAGSVIIDGGEAIADAVTITAPAGGVDILAAATFDIDITATCGRIIGTATENIQNTVHLEENGGASGSVNIYSNQGTGASATTEHDASIQLQSDDGGIGIYTTGDVANAFRLETNGGTSETIVINNLLGTGAGAITIAANATGGDLNLDSVLGRIEIEAEEDVANAIFIIADGGTSSSVRIFNDTGISATDTAASIQITSDLGGIELLSSLAAANQIRLNAAGTVVGNAVVLETTDGGIQMNADGASNGDITLDAADIMTFTSADVKIFDGAAAETWTIEGTSNGTDATIVFTDPTANITWTFPTGGADTVAIMASTLATNYPDIVNSVWGGTNQLIFEGTDADTEETVLTVIDATADNTLTLADDSGGIGYIPTGSTTKDASDAAIPLTAAVVIGTSDATSSWSLPDGNPGQVLSIIIGTDGGAATLTPDSTTGDGWATMIFTNDGEGATFMFVDSTVGWAILGTFGITTNPLTTGE